MMGLILIMISHTSRPLYGGGSGVCVYFVYVYIALWCVALFWMSLDPILPFLGWLWLPFGSLGMLVGPFGATWAPKGIFLGVNLASLWLPWDAGGTIWGTLGSQVELGVKSARSFLWTFGASAMPANKKWPRWLRPRQRIMGAKFRKSLRRGTGWCEFTTSPSNEEKNIMTENQENWYSLCYLHCFSCSPKKLKCSMGRNTYYGSRVSLRTTLNTQFGKKRSILKHNSRQVNGESVQITYSITCSI